MIQGLCSPTNSTCKHLSALCWVRSLANRGLNPGRAQKCWLKEEVLHSASCFLLSHRQTDQFAAQCLGKHQMCCLEGALHFALSCSGWQTRQRPQAASLSLGNSSQACGLKAITFSYSKPAAINATASGWTAHSLLGRQTKSQGYLCIEPTALWQTACDYSWRLQQPKLRAQDILSSW